MALLLLSRKRAVRSALKAGANPAGYIERATRDAIVVGRQRSRTIARRALAKQLGTKLPEAKVRTLREDLKRAAKIAKRQAHDIAERAAAEEGSAVERWGKALKKTEWRVSMTGSSEPWDAATAERERAAESYARETKTVLYKRWNAEHDRQTCEECAQMDGEQVPVGELFSNGASPGGVHGLCRCWEEIVAVASRRAA